MNVEKFTLHCKVTTKKSEKPQYERRFFATEL